MPTVQVIAHRGASAYAPENTLAAFELGLAMGADALETDIRVTRDGVLVLCHDATIDRVSNGAGEVAAQTWAELQRCDFGAWFAPQFRGERLVCLEAFLARYGGRPPLALELKAPGIEEQVLAAVRSRNLLADVVFTSFSFEWLEALRRRELRAQLGYLTPRFDEETIRLLDARGYAQICPAGDAATPALVECAHAAGLAVRAWGIRDEAVQELALQAGVDGMTTNWPDRLIARLQELGRRQIQT